MQEPSLHVEVFRWDDGPQGNLEHCARHQVTPVIVTQVQAMAPKFFLNDAAKTGSHMMIGPDESGRFWTIVILPTSEQGEWKAITGWPSSSSEMRRYNGQD